MKKAAAESAIRHLFGKWSEEQSISRKPDTMPSYAEFKSWTESKGYGHYFNFRSVRGADTDAELWFDEEFNQTWRN